MFDVAVDDSDGGDGGSEASRGASPDGLGFATTGALLKHAARMGQKVHRSRWVLRSPREPKNV